MEVRLLVKRGRTDSSEIALKRFPAVVGRHRSCHLRVTSRLVSRKHCMFKRRDDWLTIRDLRSSNGTVVNGQKIKFETVLKPGDMLEIGSVTFEVRYQPPKNPPKPFEEDEADFAYAEALSGDGSDSSQDLSTEVDKLVNELNELATFANQDSMSTLLSNPPNKQGALTSSDEIHPTDTATIFDPLEEEPTNS